MPVSYSQKKESRHRRIGAGMLDEAAETEIFFFGMD
jgi:hypothetical protein